MDFDKIWQNPGECNEKWISEHFDVSKVGIPNVKSQLELVTKWSNKIL